MRTPYTDSPVDAFLIAQTCTATVLTAVVWQRPMRSLAASLPLLVSIWLAALATTAAPLLDGIFGIRLDSGAFLHVLAITAALATVSCVLSFRPLLVCVALAGELALWRASHYVTESDAELANLHLAWLGLLIGLHRSADEQPPRFPYSVDLKRVVRDDWMIGCAAFSLATIVAVAVLERGCESDDEWAYTWQAAVFAHGRAYLPAYPCGDALRNYWIFYHEGRAFAQYTPGWSLFMAPFAVLRVPWLAGPTAHAMLAVAVARLARRLVAAAPEDRTILSPHRIRAAGFVGALAATTGATALINGGARYSHVWVAFLFAASMEMIASLTFDSTERSKRLRSSLLTGLLLAWLLATRVGDGAVLGTGLFAMFIYALTKRRLSWLEVGAISITFSAMAALALLILRLQLGKWFTTGYSLSGSYYAWAEPKFSLPEANQYKSGIPLSVSAFTFFPATYAVGVGGLCVTRGKARAVSAALLISSLALLAFYTLSELGRRDDFGYGNRFHLPLLVALGAGSGALLAPLFGERDPVTRRFSAAASLAGFALLAGTLRIAPLIYPVAHHAVHTYLPIERAIDRQRIHAAMIISRGTDVHIQGLDVTRNWPIPEPDVLIAGTELATEVQCLRTHYPSRKFYKARAVGAEVVIEPL